VHPLLSQLARPPRTQLADSFEPPARARLTRRPSALCSGGPAFSGLRGFGHWAGKAPKAKKHAPWYLRASPPAPPPPGHASAWLVRGQYLGSVREFIDLLSDLRVRIKNT
jgi:hypothetical protein